MKYEKSERKKPFICLNLSIQGLTITEWQEMSDFNLKDKDLTTTENTKEKVLNKQVR